MKHKSIKLLLIAACVLLFAGALSACRQKGLTEEDLIDGGYTCDVVFDLAGGTSGSGDRARTELHQFAQSGSIIVAPGDHLYSGDVPARDGYTLGGYYRGSKDADGTIHYDLTKKWDFQKDKVTGDLTLYAYWLKNYKLVVHYGTNFSRQLEVNVPQDENGVAGSVSRPSITGYTPIAYYADRKGAETKNPAKVVTFPYAPPALSAEKQVVDVWVDALEGTFQLVRTASDFTVYNGTNVYVMNDIDFEGRTISFPDDYTGAFYGNGHTLSNFRVERTTDAKSDAPLGLFNRLMTGARIEDVTFRDFTLEITTINRGKSTTIGALAGYLQTGVTLSKVTLSGTVFCDLVSPDQTTTDPFIGRRADGATPPQDCKYDGVVIQ